MGTPTYKCKDCGWIGTSEQRNKERDEVRKGNWLVCPECGCKDFAMTGTFSTLTFSVERDIETVVRDYTSVYGLPNEYKSFI